MLPCIGVAFPRVVAGLTGTRDRVGLPQQGAGVGVECINVRTGALVAAASADDKLVVDQKRSRRQRAVGFLQIVELNGLDEFAGVGLGPEDLAIARNGNDQVLI